MNTPRPRPLPVVLVVLVVIAVAGGGCGRKKTSRPAVVVDAGFVDAGSIDAGFVDAGFADAGFADAGFVDAGSVDAGFVDGGFIDVGDAGVVVEEAGCGFERTQMQALAKASRRDAAAALTASRPFWGTGVCRMDTAVRHARAEILREAAKTSLDPATKKDLLQESAELRPNADIWASLGDACDAVNDGAGAIEAWQQAVSLTASGRSRHLEEKIERLRQKLAVEVGFASRGNQHFIARFEGDARTDLADRALGILEEARTTLERSLGAVPPAPITVVLYTGDQFARSSSGPDWSSAVFDGKIRVRESQLKGSGDELRDTLFHEYLHALLRTTLGAPVPTWFNEGLAQWVEPDGGKDRITARMKARKEADLPTLAALSRSFGGERKAVRLQYDCAFDLVSELEHWRGAGSFADMFKAMGAKRMSFSAAFEDVYGMDLVIFESRWRSRYR
jgi:hypothetical protein